MPKSLSQELGAKLRGAYLGTVKAAGKLHVTQVSCEDLNQECRLAVSDDTQELQDADSACLVCRVKAKADVTY